MSHVKKSRVNRKYKHSELTGTAIGCAMKVHSQLGCGYPEVIYQRALARELDKCRISHAREIEMPIYYDGIEIGLRRADFIINGEVILELKAVSEINNAHFNQILNYLKAYQKEIGLLINFGEESLKFRRFINKVNK
ncbi:MAG: GxxExxY protein [Balneola sp.]